MILQIVNPLLERLSRRARASLRGVPTAPGPFQTVQRGTDAPGRIAPRSPEPATPQPVGPGEQLKEEAKFFNQVAKVVEDPRFQATLARIGIAVSPPGTAGARLGQGALENIQTRATASVQEALLGASNVDELRAALRTPSAQVLPPEQQQSLLGPAHNATVAETARQQQGW